MYNPCHECFIRRGASYTSECDDTCEYAKCVKTYKESLLNRDVRIRELESAFKDLEQNYRRVIRIADESTAAFNSQFENSYYK